MTQGTQELIERTAQQGNQLSMGNRHPMAAGINAGAVSIEQERAIAEAQGQLIMAKRFPRNLMSAFEELKEACSIPAFANVAFYTIPQGGSKVTGLSIRFAEEIARVYGNFEYGHRELSRTEAGPEPRDFGRSEVEIYAWDKQTNNRQIRQLTVLHVIDTKDGPRKLRDQKDIDNRIANVASKQMRGRILAMMPKWMIESASEECKKTIAGANTEPLAVRARKMIGVFGGYGVTVSHLETYLGHSLDDILLDELINLQGVYAALKEGTPASEFFGAPEAEVAAEQTGNALAATAKTAPPTKSAPVKRQTAADKADKAKGEQPKDATNEALPTGAGSDADAATAKEQVSADMTKAVDQAADAAVTTATTAEAAATGTDTADVVADGAGNVEPEQEPEPTTVLDPSKEDVF
jgi:hypothetical protein